MIDKEVFLKATSPEETVELPGIGEVRVRGLTRAEAVSLSPVKDDVRRLECRILLLGLVDPVLTEAEMSAWYEAAPSRAVDLLIAAIDSLSGLSEGAAKSGVPAVRARRRS